MENENKKKKKLVLLMLVFVVPLALLFYMLMSGGNEKNNLSMRNGANAFNDKLPAANAREAAKNKLEIYMQAQKDSEKLKDQEKQDPYAKKLFDPMPSPEDVVINSSPSVNLPKSKGSNWNKEDANEKKVKERIDNLMNALNNSNAPGLNPNYSTIPKPDPKNDEQIQRLENMLSSLKTPDTSTDPEMKQLESMLDKILDIQHPQRVNDRLKQGADEKKKDTLNYMTPIVQAPNNSLGFFSHNPSGTNNAFWGLSPEIIAYNDQSFLAVIHENQKIQDEQTIKLRLLQNVFIDKVAIPKGEFIYGKCTISNNRVNVLIQSVTYNSRVYPVQLKVYDQTDGMEGINIQGDITEQVSKEGMDKMIQQMQINAMTSSIGVQAATSGIETAKNLLSKKVRKVTVTLKSDHVLILKPIQ